MGEKEKNILHQIQKTYGRRCQNVIPSSPFSKVSLLLYDEGFCGDDMALTSALWFSFFDQGNVDPRILEALVSYVRHQMNRLNESNLEVLDISEKNKIRFPLEPVEPHVKNVFNRV